jgi:hypothetical protein
MSSNVIKGPPPEALAAPSGVSRYLTRETQAPRGLRDAARKADFAKVWARDKGLDEVDQSIGSDFISSKRATGRPAMCSLSRGHEALVATLSRVHQRCLAVQSTASQEKQIRA